MKSERRHELQHNDLAEWLQKTYGHIAPYKNAILGVLVLVIVLVVAVAFWRSHSASEAASAWNSLGVPVFLPIFADDRTIDAMQRAAQSYQGTAAAEWAQVFAGDSALMVGTNKILTDKKLGIDYLTKARDLYTEALKGLTIPGAQEQAMFGRARALESLIQSPTQLDDAKTAYEELNKRFPQGMFKVVVDQRIADLQKKDSLKFYEALAQYTPKKKAESPRNQLGNLGNLPENPPGEPVPTAPVPAGNKPTPLPMPPLTPTEPVKPQSSKVETPKSEPAKSQSASPDASKPDPGKKDAPKAEAPKPEAPKAETPKPEPAKKDK